MKQVVPRVFLAAALAGLSAYLLKGDVWTFWTWWMLAFLMGMLAMPVIGRLFAGFEDKGWIFSKVLYYFLNPWMPFCYRISYLAVGSCEADSVYYRFLYWRICSVRDFVHSSVFLSDEKRSRLFAGWQRNLDFQRGNSVFYILSFVDLCSRIPAGGSRN